ncbi:hypothetical protein LOTGIDRAFT_230378 [Lottia gigantea]|uniref:separase n=1 Tax=Lottia gigantea TaxID=225164 RepID=V4BAB7_LOTGI|nr:hypothetical protein LOTGIDRAFT_230378 [Lottia gigantea]ESP02877.1 hypothetical protein LOTGIDRAFT_230378 [Lottia gigantea]
MDEKWILKKLKSREIIDFVVHLQELFQNGRIINKQQVIFAVQFLHGIKDIVFDGIVNDDVILSTVLCCQFYRENIHVASDVIKELSVQQLLYHIFAKIPWKSHVQRLFEIGEEMYYLLQIVTDRIKEISPIIQNTYGLLWKIAGDLEKTTDFTDFSFSMKLRVLALKIHLLKPNIIVDMMNKLSLSIERYSSLMKAKQMCSVKKQREIQSTLEFLLEFYTFVSLHVDCTQCSCETLKVQSQILKLFVRFDLFQECDSYLSQCQVEFKDMLCIIYYLSIPYNHTNFDVVKLGEVLDTSLQLDLNKTEHLEIWTDLFAFCQTQMRITKFVDANLPTDLLRKLVTFYDRVKELVLHEFKHINQQSKTKTDPRIVQTEKILIEIVKCQMSFYQKVLVLCEGDDRREIIEKVKLTCQGDILLSKSLSDKSLSSFQKTYGIILEKLGLLCYNEQLEQYDIYFTELSSQLLLAYSTDVNKVIQSRAEEIHLWQVFENLSEYYRKYNEWKKAIENIIKGLCVVDSKHMVSLVKRWLQIKLAAIDSGQLKYYTLDIRCISVDPFKIKDDIMVTVLKHELQLLQKKKCSMVEYYVLKKLVEVSTSNCDKAFYLILLANTTWPSDITCKRSSEKYLEEALSLFTDIKRYSGIDKIILGQIYLWKYIQLHETTCQKFLLGKSEPVVIDNDDADDENDDDNKTRQLYSLSDEEEMIKLLERSVKLWLEAYHTPLSDTIQKHSFIESLKLTAAIYRALKKPCKESILYSSHVKTKNSNILYSSYVKKPCEECNVLLMLKSVVKGDDIAVFQANMDTVELLTSLGLCDTSLHILSSIPLPTSKNDQILYKIRQIEASLSIIQKQSEEMLLELENNLSSQKETTACFLRGTTNRLLSTLSGFSLGDNSTDLHYALDHGHDAVRLHTSVNHFFLEKKSKAGSPHQKWSIIIEVLESLLNLVKLYRYIGDDSMAKCYAREGIKTAHSLLLPRWCLLFKFELCRIYSITCCLKEAQDVLTDIASILYSNKAEKPGLTKLVSYNTNTKNIPLKDMAEYLQRKRSFADDCFGFESIRDAGIDRFSVSDVSTDPLCDDIPDINLPDHDSSCKCIACKDNSLLDLTSKYWFVLAETCFHNKFYQHAETFLRKILQRSSEIRPKLFENLLTIEKRLCESNQMMDKVPNVFNDILYESYCLLSECSVYLNSTHETQEICQKALDILDSDVRCSVEQNLLRARVNMCLVQLQMSDLNLLSLQEPAQFGKLFNSSENHDVIQNLTSKLEKCQLNSICESDLMLKSRKQPVRKIQFDSPDQQDKSRLDSSLLIPMEDSPHLADHEDSDIIPQSPKKICKVLFDTKTPLKSTTKKSALTKRKVVEEDDVFIVEDEDVPPKPKDNLSAKTLCGTPSELCVKPKRSVRSRKPKTQNDYICELKGKSRHKLGSIKTPLKIVTSSEDENDTEVKENCEPLNKLTKTKCHISRKINSTATPGMAKLKLDEVETSVKKRQSKRSTKKTVVEIGNNEENTVVKPIKPSRSTRKNKLETPRNPTKVRSGSSTTQAVDVCSPIVKDVFNFDEEESPVKPKRSTRKKDIKLGKKTKSQEIETERCKEDTPEKQFSIDFETIHEVSLDSSLLEGEEDYDIEILRGKTRSRIKDKGTQLVEILRSGVEDDVKRQQSVTNPDNNEEIIKKLEMSYQQVCHFPSNPYYPVICKLLALQYRTLSPYKTAFYLTESAAVTFRHQTLIDIGKKIRNIKKGKEDNMTNSDQKLQVYDNVRQSLIFNKEENHMIDMLNLLPSEWTVCQISMVEIAGKSSQLLLTRLTKDTRPITVPLPAFSTQQGRNLLEEFSFILETSGETVKTDDKHEFWRNRRILDEKMQLFQEDMEKLWLGSLKVLLLGQLDINEEYKQLEINLLELIESLSFSENQKQLIQVILPLSYNLNCVELAELLSIVLNITDKDLLKTLVLNIQSISQQISSFNYQHHHVILILDKSIQHLPWESLNILRNECVSRVPSLYTLSTLLTYINTNKHNIFTTGIDINKTYYIINPDDNLASTQQFFESSYVQKEGWKGVIGKRPMSSQYIEALTQNDLFIYCGHGDGVKYFQADEIQKLNCQAAVLLMGCSSGLLKPKGQLDACGTVLNYFLAGCPCVVGNLWNVTDKEIDRFCKCLLDTWLESEPGTSILQVVCKARQACRLLYLTGSAPIVYGLPVFIRK